MSLVFRENAKNRQNHGVFEGAVMRVNNFPRLLYFFGKYMLREKTSAIRYNKNYNHNFEFMRVGV